MIDLQLIADKASLSFLDQNDCKGKGYNDTMDLLTRRIAGDNPTREEWKKNYKDYVPASYSVPSLAYAFAYAYFYASVYVYVSDSDSAFASALSLSSDSDYDFAPVTVDYIIELLGDWLEPMEYLNTTVLSSIEEDGNILHMGTYHKEGDCGTTHSLFGWTIHKHPKGYELEKHFGAWMAGAIIYKKSTGHIPDFHASNDDAMADLRKRAEEETAA